MQTPAGPSVRLMFDAAGALGEVSLDALVAIWDRWLGPQRFGRKLAQLERAGFVEPGARASDTARVVRLTTAGRIAAHGGRDPESCWQRAWDGHWRMVLFDVQEKDRSKRIKLQRILRRLHFGYLQDSVWISPDPPDLLRKALEDPKIDAATLTVFEARPCGGESNADLVRGAWDFGRINRYYADYLEVLRSLPAASGESARRSWLAVEWKAWCRAVQSDPLLPVALLPPNYRGREAWKRRGEKMRRLLGLS